MGELSPWHLLIIAVVLFALFGYKKLPDASRSLARSLRIFKAETKGLRDDDRDDHDLRDRDLRDRDLRDDGSGVSRAIDPPREPLDRIQTSDRAAEPVRRDDRPL